MIPSALKRGKTEIFSKAKRVKFDKKNSFSVTDNSVNNDEASSSKGMDPSGVAVKGSLKYQGTESQSKSTIKQRLQNHWQFHKSKTLLDKRKANENSQEDELGLHVSHNSNILDDSSFTYLKAHTESVSPETYNGAKSLGTYSEGKFGHLSSPTVKQNVPLAFDESDKGTGSASGSEVFDINDPDDSSDDQKPIRIADIPNPGNENNFGQQEAPYTGDVKLNQTKANLEPGLTETTRRLQEVKRRKRILSRCLCYPETGCFKIWELFTAVILIVACFMTPFSLAFGQLDDADNESVYVFSNPWSAIDSIVDIAFIVEVIVCFNSSYFDQQ